MTNVPDMPDPGPGAMTFFYTNQQSARLMFYHDHAWGITRLNVYAGEAAPYLITDATEERLVEQGVLPLDQLPLVIQDKTFVPSTEQLAASDPLWDVARWGGLGSLWVPHVYVPAQNPGDSSGVNQFGRWAYGPGSGRPRRTSTTRRSPIPTSTPSCNPTCPIPGASRRSCRHALPVDGEESFNDTPLVNGTAIRPSRSTPSPIGCAS